MGGVWACLCLCFKQPGLLWLHTLHTGESVLVHGSIWADSTTKMKSCLRWSQVENKHVFTGTNILSEWLLFQYFSSPFLSILDSPRTETAQGTQGGIIFCWGLEWEKVPLSQATWCLKRSSDMTVWLTAHQPCFIKGFCSNVRFIPNKTSRRRWHHYCNSKHNRDIFIN